MKIDESYQIRPDSNYPHKCRTLIVKVLNI